jgi:hypothetical protein
MKNTSILLAATVLSAQCLLGSCHLKRHGAGEVTISARVIIVPSKSVQAVKLPFASARTPADAFNATLMVHPTFFNRSTCQEQK